MKPVDDAAWRAFKRTTSFQSFKGQRVKGVRDTPLSPGGRVALTLFEAAPGGERPHPRLRTSQPPVAELDPRPLLSRPERAPREATAFEAWLRLAWQAAQPRLKAPEAQGPSPRFRAHSRWGQRCARFFAEARAALDGWLASGDLPATQAEACRYAWACLRDEALIGAHPFDDQDTGTYHSYGKDSPFVHYLEAILDSLPEEASVGMALLEGDQQESIRRQRRQAQAHLDHLMRHKYAYKGIVETDIERSLGGFLIDRRSRQIVSEDPASVDSLVPRYQLLRIDPTSNHPQAGAWVYRDGTAILQEGRPIEVAPELLRATPIAADQLSFRRAPKDPGLRAGIRLDWDGSGYVQPDEIGWVGWAGHCDIKAIMEALGIALLDQPAVREYRSDTDRETTYDRKLLVEMIASVMELGSGYDRADGSGSLQRGERHFGGARNDSRPDRLQFQGFGPGKSFRWPLGGRQESFRVTGIEVAGQDLDLERVFYAWLPTAQGLDIVANPRFLGTVEGDYNLIRVSGATVRASVQEDRFDVRSGYPINQEMQIELDLRPDAPAGRSYLGSSIKDAASREVYQVWLDRSTPGEPRIEAKLERWERGEGGYAPVPQPQGDVVLPMVDPLEVTLSREMRRDDPAAFQTLLDRALRQGLNLCADTDKQAEVWNGVVTHIDVARLAWDRQTRTERWRVGFKARFGEAELDYLLKREADGRPSLYCPVAGEGDAAGHPDFLWQDYPDVASKGVEGGDWVVNQTMKERGIIEVDWVPDNEGGVYVHDDHIKNVYELLYCGLSGLSWTLVHGNKRYAYRSEAAWTKVVKRLKGLRQRIQTGG